MSLRKFIFISVLVLGLLVSGSCTKIDREYDETTAYKVLVLGNSLSRDAFSYAPWIMENVSKGMKLDIEILYVGGAGLNTHMSYINENRYEFIHDIYTSRTHTWASFPEVGVMDVVGEKDWDLIVFQDGTGNSRNYSKFESDIISLKEFFDSVIENPHYAIMMNPARPDGSSALSGTTSLDDYNQVAKTASEILDAGLVEMVIPCGTAVQQARKMSLDGFGEFGHMSYDGKHLQEGIPCQVEALTVAQALIDYANRSGSIDDCSIKPNAKWVNERYIPGKHGIAQDATEDQYELTKYCARMALELPFSLDYNEFIQHFPKIFLPGTFLLQAHRGLSERYPENTLPAFEAAGRSEEFLAIETDVQSTKDGILVCMHDSSIERTTNGTGDVKDHTYADLCKYYIDGGNGWDDDYGNTLKIPTFEDYLDVCRKYAKIPYIDLKSLDKKGIENVIGTLHSKNFSDEEYVLTSFSSYYLEIAEKYSSAPMELMKKSFTDEEIEKYAVKKNYSIRPVAETVSKDFVDKCHDLGLWVDVWNISTDLNSALKVVSTGVDGGTCNSNIRIN